MSSHALFPSRLGAAFAQLDPTLQWVHNGASREMRGTVTVERGTSTLANLLGALTSLPPALQDAPIEVRIDTAGEKERWVRTYAGRHQMSSTLYRGGSALIEQVGPVALKFRVITRNAGMDLAAGTGIDIKGSAAGEVVRDFGQSGRAAGALSFFD